MNSPVKEIRAVGLPILSGKADIANVRLEFESGCVANFTASRVSTERVRKMRFFQPRQYVSLDYSRQDVLVFSVGDGEMPGTPSVNPQIKVAKPAIVAEEPLQAEIKSFLACVRTRSQHSGFIRRRPPCPRPRSRHRGRDQAAQQQGSTGPATRQV